VNDDRADAAAAAEAIAGLHADAGAASAPIADEDGVILLPSTGGGSWSGGSSSAAPAAADPADGDGVQGGLVSIGGGRMECSICLDVYASGEAVTVLGCGHLFHTGCVVPWLRTNVRCPLCKASIRERRGGRGGG